MPVYNELATVEQAVAELLDADLGIDTEVILVDDGSTDGTSELIARPTGPTSVTVLSHDVNQGKGAAVRTALAHARASSPRSSTPTSSTTPTDLAALLPPLTEGRSNAVFGVRAFDGYTSHSFLFVMGNKGVTLAANILFNVYLRDLMTCHKAIRTEVFRRLPLRPRGFDIEPEIAARLLQRGERIFEVPVHYKARSTEEGKKLTAVDGLRVIATLLRCRLSGAARK